MPDKRLIYPKMVHLDFRRTKDWQIIIEEASNYFVVGNPDGLKDMGIIEPYSDEHQILLVLPKEQGNLWNCLDIELLALTQSFANIHVDGELLAIIDETKESPNILERIFRKFKLKKDGA